MLSTPSPRSNLRIYDRLRSAHIERLADMVPASMWYLDTRADFDSSLIDPDNPPRRMRQRDVVIQLARQSFDGIELNEPASLDLWPMLLASTAAVRARDLLTRHHTVITTYCIENAVTADKASDRWGLPTWLAGLITRSVVSALTLGTNRMAFGTAGSLTAYEHMTGHRLMRSRSRLFEALPSPCPCLSAHLETSQHPAEVLFLGSFLERKGIRQTMAAWDALREIRPTAHLRMIGTGRLQAEVETWARGREDVTLELDPPRDRIHEVLRDRPVVILLSQRVGTWREQIGLPVLEGIAHGCEVVTTTETGLADWLESHGHSVVAPTTPALGIARHIDGALDRRATRSGSLAELPAVDQRIAADRWMFQAADES